MMTTDQLNQLASDWFDAFNRHDLDALLALYHDHALHYSPKLKIRQPDTNGWISGKDALRSWWRDAFDRLTTLRYEIIRFTPYNNRVFLEYIRHVDGESDMLVGEMLEVEGRKIVKSMVFHT